MTAQPTATTARALLRALPAVLVIACSDAPTAPDDAEPLLAVVSGQNQTGMVGQMLPQPITVRVGRRSAPIEGAIVNFVVSRGGGTVWAGSALTDARGLASDWWIMGNRTDSIHEVEVRAVLPGGSRRVYGVFSATALPDAPAVIDRLLPPGVAAELNPVVPAPGLRVSDRFLNPVAGHPVVFNILRGGGTVDDTVYTDANGVALAADWTPGAFTSTDTIARLRMRVVAFHPPVPADSVREAQVRLYPVTGRTLIAASGDGQTGPIMADMRLCVGMRDAEDDVVQPHPHHVQAVTWMRNGTPATGVDVVGFDGANLCYDVSPRLGSNTFVATIRGMAGEAVFTVTGT